MSKGIKYDKDLWFEHDDCEGKHFILGNPHTFPGRIYAWCPKKETSLCVSKSEIGKMSQQTEYWIKGFLSGNTPTPPQEENNEDYYASKEYSDWLKKSNHFQDSGDWEKE